jgi:hypothetical protein
MPRTIRAVSSVLASSSLASSKLSSDAFHLSGVLSPLLDIRARPCCLPPPAIVGKPIPLRSLVNIWQRTLSRAFGRSQRVVAQFHPKIRMAKSAPCHMISSTDHPDLAGYQVNMETHADALLRSILSTSMLKGTEVLDREVLRELATALGIGRKEYFSILTQFRAEGMISISRKGWSLTPKGIEHAREAKPIGPGEGAPRPRELIYLDKYEPGWEDESTQASDSLGRLALPFIVITCTAIVFLCFGWVARTSILMLVIGGIVLVPVGFFLAHLENDAKKRNALYEMKDKLLMREKMADALVNQARESGLKILAEGNSVISFTNSPIIDRSTLYNAMNSKAAIDSGIQDSLQVIAGYLQSSSAHEAIATFNELSKKIGEKDNKLTIGALWRRVVELAPDVLNLGEAAVKLVGFING